MNAVSPDNVTVTINVHFHIILNTSGEGNMTDETVMDQIEMLNAGFAGLDTLPNGTTPRGSAMNTPFRFVLAGITRTVNNTWFADNDEAGMKAALRVGDAQTLNIYTNNTDFLGYATLPWWYSSDPTGDGVVILHTTVPGGTEPGYNEGDTLIHEVGHWLGLFHTFQGGCSKYNDFITDTPAEAAPFFGDFFPGGAGPNTIPDSCSQRTFPGVDSVENYMNYSNDASLYRFTGEQSRRCDVLSQIYRDL
ncbi:MAG: hypothetical protein OHK0029_01050 [Armatimonadaceae bacterium]